MKPIIKLHAIWDRKLSEDELRHLADEPYCMLKPLKTYFWTDTWLRFKWRFLQGNGGEI